MTDKIFNIPASCSFADALAQKFGLLYADNPAALSEVLFLLPNRRACAALREAFVRFNGLKPSILPRMLPIGDMNEDEILLDSSDYVEILEKLPPAVDKYERLFLLSKLIMSKPGEYGLPKMTLSQAFALAQSLGVFLDSAYNEQISFSRLKDIVPVQYAAHWQETLKFLNIITQYWPQILQERGLLDAVARQNQLLEIQAEIWAKNPPHYKVVAAGTTADFPGYQKLLKVLLQSAAGEIFIHGLDQMLDEQAWIQIDESHPQYELKQLLSVLNLKRSAVLNYIPPLNPHRERLVSDLMRPAASTAEWRCLSGQTLCPEAIEHLHTAAFADPRQEAAAIALLMREALETPGKTAALVTTDRALARRTASILERWNIKIDDSAGKPLQQTPVGIFLRLIASAAEEGLIPSALLALAKNPYVRIESDNALFRQTVREWELQTRTPSYHDTPRNFSQIPEWMKTLHHALDPLKKLYSLPRVSFKNILQAHLQAAENLSGENVLWSGDDGKAAAALFSKIFLKAEIMGEIDPSQYVALLTQLMSAESVRPAFGTHPRLKILGPIEARFNQYDRIIIGALNEGIFPKMPEGDPWLSRPMKKSLGMSLPEKSIGVMAGDFSRLFCAPEVWLTRSERTDGTPTNKSRWLLRLETVLKAYGIGESKLHDYSLSFLLDLMEKPIQVKKIVPPAPTPPIWARPRRLSASAVEKLMRDPYEIYAAKILKLKPLRDLDQRLSPADYGNLLHRILEEFNRRYPQTLPENAQQELEKIGVDVFHEHQIAEDVRAFWWPAFEKTVAWLLEVEKSYRLEISHIYSETTGEIQLEAPAGKFVVEARADRIDYTKDGKINIIDYKTGEPCSNKVVRAGYAPQLPIEGLIARAGGFRQNQAAPSSSGQSDNLPAAAVEKLIYWKLAEKSFEISGDINLLLDETFERLQKLIAVFDFETTPYLARPNPKHWLKYSEYEHLARVKEWSTAGDNNE